MKKFLSVFCAIAMMATLVVPSYAADYFSAKADKTTLTQGTGVQNVAITYSIAEVRSYGFEADYNGTNGVNLPEGVSFVSIEKDTTGSIGSFGAVTVGTRYLCDFSNNPEDYMDTANGDIFTITYAIDTTNAGTYEIPIHFDLFLDADVAEDLVTKIVVEEAAQEPVVSADFGSEYAYVREHKYADAVSYELCLVSALKNLDGYSAVGFEVKVGDAEVKVGDEITTAYRTFRFNGQTIDIAQLGDGFEFLYYDSFVFGAENADNAVEFRAYGIDGDGNTVYGAWKTIDALAK